MHDRRLSNDPRGAPEPGSHKLAGKVALITGGETRMGRATGLLFAREGADIAFTHLARHEEARELARAVEREGRRCLPMCGDVSDPDFCELLVARVIARFGGVDVLINHLAEGASPPSFFSLFYLTRRLLPYLRHRPGANIVNTVTDQRDATREAVGEVTRSLAHNLAGAQIRVNAFAPTVIAAPEPPRLDNIILLASPAATVTGELFDPDALWPDLPPAA